MQLSMHSDLYPRPVELFQFPIEVRGHIWRQFKIGDFGNLLLSCRKVKNTLENQDFPYIATTLMKIQGLENASFSDLTTALSHIHQINKLFIIRFPFCSDYTIVGLHEKIERELQQDKHIQLIRTTNQINLKNYIIRNRFLAYLTPDLKTLLTSIIQDSNDVQQTETKEPKLILTDHESEVNLNDLLTNTALFKEFATHNYDIKKLLNNFGQKIDDVKKFNEQIKKLMSLCAILKLFKCTPRSLKLRHMAPVRELLFKKWGSIYKLFNCMSVEPSLKKLLQLEESKRYHIIKNCEAIINLFEDRMFSFSALERIVSLRTICDAHKMHQALTQLYLHIDEELRAWLLTQPLLVEEIYEQAEYLQDLINQYSFSLTYLLKMNAKNRKNFVNHSREILKLCQSGTIKLDQLFHSVDLQSNELNQYLKISHRNVNKSFHVKYNSHLLYFY